MEMFEKDWIGHIYRAVDMEKPAYNDFGNFPQNHGKIN